MEKGCFGIENTPNFTEFHRGFEVVLLIPCGLSAFFGDLGGKLLIVSRPGRRKKAGLAGLAELAEFPVEASFGGARIKPRPNELSVKRPWFKYAPEACNYLQSSAENLRCVFNGLHG
jgi:hypothetical protein